MYVRVLILYKLFFDFTKLFLKLALGAYLWGMINENITWVEFEEVVDLFIKDMKDTLIKGSRDAKFMSVFASRFNRWKKNKDVPFTPEWAKKTIERFGEGKYVVGIFAMGGIAEGFKGHPATCDRSGENCVVKFGGKNDGEMMRCESGLICQCGEYMQVHPIR